MGQELVRYFREDLFPVLILIGATVLILGALVLGLRKVWGDMER